MISGVVNFFGAGVMVGSILCWGLGLSVFYVIYWLALQVFRFLYALASEGLGVSFDAAFLASGVFLPFHSFISSEEATF